MAESIHKKLERVRKPRVHITYEVETEGAVVLRELPFVVGVMGDYSGNAPGKEKPSLEERKFISIDRDNFDDVMEKIKPGAAFAVENTLDGNGTEMKVNLQFGIQSHEEINDLDAKDFKPEDFRGMKGFEPAAVVKQIAPLRKLLESRNKLRDLMTKADSSQELERLLEEVLQKTEGADTSQKLSQLAEELGIKPPTEDKP
jgi:type VI secretion system protein ImpB